MHLFSNFFNGIVAERVTELKVLVVVLDTKLSFESHIRLTAASASSKLGISRKAICLFRDPVLILRCFLELTASSVGALLFRCLL